MFVHQLNNIFFRLRIIWHLVFWIVYVLLNSVMYGRIGGDYFNQFQLQLYYLPVVLAATYITLYLLIPRFLVHKKYFLFAFWLITATLFMSFLQRINIFLFVLPRFYPDYDTSTYSIFSVDIIFRVLMEFPVVVFAALLKIVKLWYLNQQYNQKLIQDKLQAELKFLKSQIHPHFLFNTLNNLYALTLKKSDLAPKMVLRLSDLLSYMLYESNVPMISLDKEVEILNNFIELEKIRYGNMLKINFSLSGNTQDKQIAPLLLLPFVENAFKHGVSKKLSNKWINIKLIAEDSQIHFEVENSKEDGSAHIAAEYSEGIGLKNVRRRLDLLYADKHHLDIKDQGNVFQIELLLDINHSVAELKDEH